MWCLGYFNWETASEKVERNSGSGFIANIFTCLYTTFIQRKDVNQKLIFPSVSSVNSNWFPLNCGSYLTRYSCATQSCCAPKSEVVGGACVSVRVRRWEQGHRAADGSNSGWEKRHIFTLCRYLSKGGQVYVGICSCTYLKISLCLGNAMCYLREIGFRHRLFSSAVAAVWKWVEDTVREDRRGFVVTGTLDNTK